MLKPPMKRQLPNALKKRINRLAHTSALRHESAMRQRLLDEMQRMASHGADLQALEIRLSDLEGAS